MHERAVLGSLVAAVVGVAVWVQASVPATLLTPPDRPDEQHGDPRVRTDTAEYPRSATGTDDIRVSIKGPARRIVSQYWSADEYLYSVVPPDRVVGVSDTAYAHASSNVLPFVEQYRPVVATDPEQVLRANPDLVLTPESARSDVPALLRAAGVPVYRIYTRFETLQAIEDHIRLIGYLTGEDDRARDELDRFQRAIQRAVARRPPGAAAPRVLGIGGSYSYGTGTIFHDVLRVLGAENLAATHGFRGYDRVTDEHIVRWDPDWIIAGADRGQVDIVRARLLDRPAVTATSAARHGHVIVIENDVFLPMSPYTARLVEALSEAFYGGADRDR